MRQMCVCALSPFQEHSKKAFTKEIVNLSFACWAA